MTEDGGVEVDQESSDGVFVRLRHAAPQFVSPLHLHPDFPSLRSGHSQVPQQDGEGNECNKGKSPFALQIHG